MGFYESLVAANEFIESCPIGAMSIGICALLVFLLSSLVGTLLGRFFALLWIKLVRSKLNRGGE